MPLSTPKYKNLFCQTLKNVGSHTRVFTVVSLFRDPRRSRACTALTKSEEKERLLAVQCRCEGYGFQAVYSGVGYINQRVWVQDRVSFSRKLINWQNILAQTKETGNCHSKYKESKSVLFWLDFASDLSSFWTTATLGLGGGGDFGSLVQYRVAKFC